MNAQSELKCQVIPVESGSLLVPENLVEEVVILEERDTQQEITWRSRTIPIVQNDSNDKPTTRVVVLRSVMGYSGLPFIAIATDGIPHMVTVSADSLTYAPEAEVGKTKCALAATYAHVGSLVCVIPDLPKLESRIHKKMAAA